MKYLVSYAIRPMAALKLGHHHWSFGSMVTELKPAEWQLWATTKNWPKEGDSDIFAADVVLINHWPIVNGELAKELEEETT